MSKLGGCLALTLALALTTACAGGDDDKDPTGETSDTESDDPTGETSDSESGPTDTDATDTEPTDTEPTDTESDTEDTDPPVEVESIYDVQQGVIKEGSWIVLEGVVTAINPYGAVIQDPLGGEYSAIYVYQGSSWDEDSYARGDVIQAEGYVYEYAPADYEGSLTELDVSSGSITLVDTADEPSAEEVLAEDLLADEEPWESVLIEIVDVTAESSIDTDRRFTIDGVNVDDELYEYANVYAGDTFTSIGGIYWFARGNFQILPRDADDIQGQSSEVTALDDLDAGDLFVTEVMVNPSTCDDDDSEYFEMYNNAGGTIDLSGLEVADNSTRTATFDEVYLVEAGAYVIVSKRTTNPCYDFQDDVDLNFTFGLSNSGDELTLTSSTTTLDEVVFTEDKIEAGYSLSLDPSKMSADDNDDMASWCLSETVIEDSSDYGTPGEENDCTAPADTGDSGTSDTDSGTSDTDTAGTDTAGTDTSDTATDSGTDTGT